MPRISATPALTLAAAALLAGAPGDSLVPVFEPGGELTRTFEEETSWSLDTMSMVMDDEPVEQDLPAVEGRCTRRIVVLDRLRQVGEGRVLELAREFQELVGASALQVEDQETSREYETASSSALEGLEAVFSWDEAEGSYACAYAEGSAGPPGLLEGLVLACDLAAFLPPADVAQGETWDVPAAALAEVLSPSGALALAPVEFTPGGLLSVPNGPIVATAFAGAGGAAGELEGEIQATYAGAEEQDGVRVARVELELDVVARADRSAPFREALERAGQGNKAELSVELDLEGTAHFLWDLDHGRALSFELDGEVVLHVELAWEERILTEALPMTAEFEASGTTRLTARFE